MNKPLDDQYLEWLYKLVSSNKEREGPRSRWQLLHHIHGIPFSWFVPNDDNRAEDGKELREEFIYEAGVNVEESWLDLECSMLEVLLALARRAAFESSEPPDEWFWKLIENINLLGLIDRYYDRDAQSQIDEAINRVLMRTYTRDGHGGLFPLRQARRDQRKVEIWYQMASYLLEGHSVNDGR